MITYIICLAYVVSDIYREMENACGHVQFQNNYSRVHVQLSGSCKMWRSGVTSEDGGWLSTDVFVDTVDQKWHANLKVVNLFAPVRYCFIGKIYLTILVIFLASEPAPFNQIVRFLCLRAVV